MSAYAESALEAAQLLRPDTQPIPSAVEIGLARQPDPIWEQRKRAQLEGVSLHEIQKRDMDAAAIANSGAAKKLEAAEREYAKAKARFENEKATAEGIASQFRLLQQRADDLHAQIQRAELLRSHFQNLVDSIEAGIPEQLGHQNANVGIFMNSARELLAARELLKFHAPWRSQADKALEAAQTELSAFQKLHKIGI